MTKKQYKAKRLCFFAGENGEIYNEKEIEFDFHRGFALSQKRKNIESFHTKIAQNFPNKKILEVSTKSLDEIGKKFSAFNLSLNKKPLEIIFQKAKVFKTNDGLMKFDDICEILNLNPEQPHEFKKVVNEFLENEKNAKLSHFEINGKRFDLEPKSAFYDYIYILALLENKDNDELLKYEIFTDIEFNHKRQINCQARSCSIFVSLKKSEKLQDYLEFDNFKKLYRKDSLF